MTYEECALKLTLLGWKVDTDSEHISVHAGMLVYLPKNLTDSTILFTNKESFHPRTYQRVFDTLYQIGLNHEKETDGTS